MIYIFLSILCSLSIAQLLKWVELKNIDVLKVLVFNYSIAASVSFFSTEWNLDVEASSLIAPILLATFLGLLFILNMIFYSKSIHNVGMGISIAAMRMSLLVPIAISFFVYSEFISSLKMVGIALALISLFLIVPISKISDIKKSIVLIFPFFLFLITGFADGGLKIFDEEFSSILNESQFLTIIFGAAFIIGTGLLMVKKAFSFSLKEMSIGTIVGIVNLYSTYFLLLALKELSGALVFSIINVSLIVLGTIIGIFVWKDTSSYKQRIGLGLAIFSIIILLT